MNPAEKPRRHGCLFWGGIIAGILLVLALLAGYAGYHYIHHLVNEYTDTRPLEIPTVQMSGTEITNLQRRVESFDKAIETDKPVEPLVLTADEINALIAESVKTNTPAPPRLYFSFNEDHVQAQLSMPTDGFGLRMLKGRYFNGSGEFALALYNGHLKLNVRSLSVKGKPLPEQFMQSLRAENFADSWTNDVKLNQALAKLQQVKIENGKLIVIPKMNETNSAPKLNSPLK
ncbi:MAG TPA: hypothetical protein VG938_13900 [Verrucomicrobiae bacterium]|jgi:hypothetical protein|nr:hypothetical protein [Verrucomicrobiae bacterium]